jgi:uncharacterized protein with HEPN domain
VTEHDPRLYLIHIVESAEFVASYIEGRDSEAFAADQQLQDAVIRRIEIMGEAVKNLSQDVRDAHPEVPWRRIAGMRDKVIHDYTGVDVDLVWTVASELMPQLRDDVRTILDGFGSDHSRWLRNVRVRLTRNCCCHGRAS